MYTPSIYSQWFSHKGEWYLYNAQTNFFGKISEKLISVLEEREWDNLDAKSRDFLLTRHIIEQTGHEYDYFQTQKMLFNNRNYDSSSLHLVIAPTTACNFACPYCFEPKLNPLIISDQVIQRLFTFIKLHDNAKKLSVTWYGGEPLVAFHKIQKIIDGLQMDGIPALTGHSMVTNGSLLTKPICEYFNHYRLRFIQLTLDGDKIRHDQTRFYKADGRGSFDDVYSKIQLIRDNIPECNIGIRVNVDKTTLDDYLVIYKKLSEDFKEDPHIRTYPGFIRVETRDGKSMRTHCVKPEDVLDVYKYLNSHGLNGAIFPTIKRRGCMIHSMNSYIIGPEGELYKCWNDVSSPSKVIGTIADRYLSNSSLMSRYMVGVTPFRDECRDCKVFPICDGGCGYYQYKNLYETGKFSLCSTLKYLPNLKDALLNGALSKITRVSED